MKLKLKIKLKKIIPYGLLAFYLFFTIISFIYTPPKHNITRKELEEINQKTRLKQNEKKNKNNQQLIQSSIVVEQQNNQTRNEPLEYDNDNNYYIENEEHIKLLEFQCYDDRTSIYDIFIYQQVETITQERIVERYQEIHVPKQIWKQYFLYEYLPTPLQIQKQVYSFDKSWKTYFSLTCSQVDQYMDDQEINIIEGHNQQLQPSFLNNYNKIWKQYFLHSFSNLDEIIITNNKVIIDLQKSDSDIKSTKNDEDSIIQNDVLDLIDDQEDPKLSLDQNEMNLSENQLITDSILLDSDSLSQIQIDNAIIGLLNQTTSNYIEQGNSSLNTIKDVIQIIEHVQQVEQDDQVEHVKYVEHVEQVEHAEQFEQFGQQQTLQNEEFVQQFDESQMIDEIQVNQSDNKFINNTQLLQNESLIEENNTTYHIDQMRIASNITDNRVSIEPRINSEYINNITIPDRQLIHQCEPTQDDETHDITFLVILILITHIIIFIVEKSKKQNQIFLEEEDNMLTHELFELSVIFQEFIKFQKVYNENVLLSQALLEQSIEQNPQNIYCYKLQFKSIFVIKIYKVVCPSSPQGVNITNVRKHVLQCLRRSEVPLIRKHSPEMQTVIWFKIRRFCQKRADLLNDGVRMGVWHMLSKSNR
ncbi:hypothetical protein pb186bvf_018030 [Paramecium bursaria]